MESKGSADYYDLLEMLTEYYKNNVDTLFPSSKRYDIIYNFLLVAYLISAVTLIICVPFIKTSGKAVITLLACVAIISINIGDFFTIVKKQKILRNKLLKEENYRWLIENAK